jgi:hypothetical protein
MTPHVVPASFEAIGQEGLVHGIHSDDQRRQSGSGVTEELLMPGSSGQDDGSPVAGRHRRTGPSPPPTSSPPATSSFIRQLPQPPPKPHSALGKGGSSIHRRVTPIQLQRQLSCSSSHVGVRKLKQLPLVPPPSPPSSPPLPPRPYPLPSSHSSTAFADYPPALSLLLASIHSKSARMYDVATSKEKARRLAFERLATEVMFCDDLGAPPPLSPSTCSPSASSSSVGCCSSSVETSQEFAHIFPSEPLHKT